MSQHYKAFAQIEGRATELHLITIGVFEDRRPSSQYNLGAFDSSRVGML